MEQGLYKSDVKFNTHGNLVETLIRRNFNVPDDNGFASFFVLESYLETITLLDAQTITPLFSQDYFEDTMDALVGHRSVVADFPFRSDLPIYNFWNSKENEQKTQVQWPDNLEYPLRGAAGLNNFIYKVLKIIHLESFYDKIYQMIQQKSAFLYVFQIVADSDDTGMNLVVGSQLTRINRKYPQIAVGNLLHKWNASNHNFSTLFELIVKYSYCPYSSELDKNLIDGRTYFWLREYITSAENAAAQSAELCFITTWIANLSTDKQSSVFGVRVPLHVNNVDASVASNFMYGASKYLLEVDTAYVNEALFKLFNNNLLMLSFILENDWITKRNDFVLLYYPPVYNFYWFVARLFKLLKTNENTPYVSSLKVGLDRLEHAIDVYEVDQLMKLAQYDDDNGYAFFDDYLGNGDERDGKPKQFHEDRVFSTATALNAMMDIFTSGDGVELKFVDSIPEKVRTTIDQMVHFLVQEGDNNYKTNIFFSGSVKAGFDLGMFLPHNYSKYFDDAEVDCAAAFPSGNQGDTVVIGVSGIMSDQEWDSQIATGQCFGVPFKLNNDYKGLNCPSCYFPFWSSEPVTESFSMLAIAKYYRATINDNS